MLLVLEAKMDWRDGCWVTLFRAIKSIIRDNEQGQALRNTRETLS